jgi:hypothetical protein
MGAADLFTDAKTREDDAQQIVWRELSRDGVERVLAQSQLFGQ